jgi:hypothetical protein
MIVLIRTSYNVMAEGEKILAKSLKAKVHS